MTNTPSRINGTKGDRALRKAAKSAEAEAKKPASGITHEDPDGVPVPDEKPCRRGRQDREQQSHDIDSVSHRRERAADPGHSNGFGSGDPVDAVHEVREIDQPGQRQPRT